jgi:hypothetical protein
LSLLIALFVGGMAATRLDMVFDKAAGAFEGALVWVLSFLVILWLASSGVRLVASGISGLFSGRQTISSAATGVDDLSAGDVNQIIGRLSDPQTARALASATGMSEQEVQSTLSGVAQRVEAVRDNPEQAAAEVRRGIEQLMARAREQLPVAAHRVQGGASQTAWITFAAMLISLLAAIAGAMFGRRRAVERLAGVEDGMTTARVRCRRRACRRRFSSMSLIVASARHSSSLASLLQIVQGQRPSTLVLLIEELLRGPPRFERANALHAGEWRVTAKSATLAVRVVKGLVRIRIALSGAAGFHQRRDLRGAHVRRSETALRRAPRGATRLAFRAGGSLGPWRKN